VDFFRSLLSHKTLEKRIAH